MAGTLFMVSASEFDQKLREDSKENRLKESTIIFRTIVNNQAFKDTTFILFVNKMDLLEEKVNSKRADISEEFDQFSDIAEVTRVLGSHTGLKFKAGWVIFEFGAISFSVWRFSQDGNRSPLARVRPVNAHSCC